VRNGSAVRRFRTAVETGVPPFAVAFVFAAVASTALAMVRLSHGAGEAPPLPLPLLMVVLASMAALLAFDLLEGGLRVWPGRLEWIASQLLAVVCAMVLVHLVLRCASAWLPLHLIEGPRQLVNDMALAGCTLGLVWSTRAVRPASRLVLLSAALVGVACYGATAMLWHMDPFPGTPVQRFVVTLVGADAAALLVFDVLRSTFRAS
jgi:hypothetical protein